MFFTYIQTNWVEIVGVILSLIYIYLSIKQKVSLWIYGFLSSALYIVVFFRTKFYADMSLQVYYLVISVYGWFNWKLGKPSSEKELPATKASTRLMLQLAVSSIVIYVIYYLILSRFTDSTIPKADSLVGMLSVVGTWMLARKLLENWLVWIVADGIATGLFIYKGLYPTAILFVIYTVMSVAGYWQWKKTTGI
ncbi:MAG: nicotinamide riboside transporter PnuC [Bacteroidota bacterium]|nr:nicotinamide riboside transporter PnuC [Bacteroidota bacterium]